MLLAIDCGNTNIVFALFQGQESRGEWRIETKSGRTADEYTAWLSHLLSLSELSLQHIDDVIIASVVPQVTDHLKRFAHHNLNCQPLVVGEPDVKLGVTIDIDMPSQVGADRLVNAHAATTIASLPAIILDFGTATTFDLIQQGHSYAGGVIAPGIALSAQALSQAAARLPEIDITPFGDDLPIIGRDTQAAMRAGVFWGYVAMIEGVIERIQKSQNSPISVIATGGLAHLFAPHIQAITKVDAHLTMRGLLEIYELNKV